MFAIVAGVALHTVAETSPSQPGGESSSVIKMVQSGRERLASGDLAGARTLAENAVASDSGYAEGWKLLGRLRVQAGETNAATQAFRNALLIAPRDPTINRELGWLLWNEDRDKALASLEVVLQSNPPDRDAVVRRVLGLLAETEQEAKALELFERWKPSFTLPALGVSLYQAGRHKAAYPFLSAAWESGLDKPVVGLYLVAAENKRGRPEKALACLKAFFQTAPVVLPAEQQEPFWEAVLSMGQVGALKDLWEKIESRYPADPEQWPPLAARFEAAATRARYGGDLSTASEFYRQAMNLDPNRACWADRDLIEERLNGVVEASRQLKLMLARASKPAVTDGMNARMDHYAGDLDGAMIGYRSSLEKNPDQLTLRLFLVRDLLASNRTDEARQEVRMTEALNKGSLSTEQRMDLADFWIEIGDAAHAIQLVPNLLVEKTRRELVAGDLDKALKMASLAVATEPANADAWRMLGMTHSRLQSYGESKMALERALTLRTNDVAALDELGWTLWALNDRPGAEAVWDRALASGVKDKERFVRLIVARMAEDNQKDRALELHARWLPGTTPLATGLELFKAGRMKAAEPFLAQAWDAGGDRALAGLYLGRVRSINGVYAGTPAYFMPYITSCLATAPVQEVTLVLDGLKLCSGVAGLRETLDEVARVTEGRADQAAAITDLYLVFARDEYDRRDYAGSLAYYEKLFARDPNRKVWATPLNLSRRLNELPRGMQLLSNLLARTSSPAVKHGVEGKLAELRGDSPAARAAYEASLKADPIQPDVRNDLFDIYLSEGELGLARQEANWIEERIRLGEVRLREVLAMMRSQLGDDEKARELWRFLHLSMPDDAPYYGTELAMAQLRTGHAEEAIANLKDLVIHTPIPLAYELMVQMSAALGRPADAVQSARDGLAAFSTANLRRGLAENLEAIQMPATATATVAAARASLADDAGSVSASLLVARALEAAGRAEEAAECHRQYLDRNPVFVPGLVFMRDHEIVKERPRHALPYAERLIASRPADDEAVRRYAMNLGEADGFSRAIRILEPLARQDEKAVTATLVYDNTTPFNYAGMNTVSQMVSHIVRLTREGFVFINDLPAKRRPDRSVMMILLDPDSAVVEAVDAALQSNKASAIVMMSPASLQHPVPRKPTPDRLAELRRSGRWQVGVTIQDPGSAVVRSDGIQGNPLTHRVVTNGVPETLEAMSNRVLSVLTTVASRLDKGKPRFFFYPAGDYGQMSLDTDPAAMGVLSNAVDSVFAGAFCRDDYGFISSRLDSRRVPAKTVSPNWSADDLVHHLRQVNPVVKSRLELAKLYYWHGQSEAAAHWFRMAYAAGANPFEVTFNQAANAAMEGDLPVAIRQAREAIRLAPPEEHRPVALLEKALNMRRPTASLRGNEWWDNEDRSYWEIAAAAEGPLRDWLRWNAAVSRHDWEKKRLGYEMGSEAELGFLAYVAPEVWVHGGLQEWFMDSLPDLDGWEARLHLPNQYLHGSVELTSQREMMETVEALRAGIKAHREGIETYSRLFDFWDCFLDGALTERSDGNDTWWVNGRFIRRLKETPYFGIGYAGRLADSTLKVPQYWSPDELQQHQAYAAWQGTGVKWNGQLSGQTGFAKERNTGWRYIWGGRAVAIYKFTQRLNVGGDVTYQSGPIYSRATLDAFINLRW